MESYALPLENVHLTHLEQGPIFCILDENADSFSLLLLNES